MTEKRYTDLNPHARILLGPGPGMAAPRVIRAMATPPVGHLDPDLLAIYAEEQELLRYVFQTENAWTFALSGTGTSGMEAALTNLIEPGDDVLVAIIGYFGERLAEIATRQGANVDRVNKQLGEIFEVEEIEAALKAEASTKSSLLCMPKRPPARSSCMSKRSWMRPISKARWS